jgi:nucleotide-binding universal stress UspA family protein
MPYKTVLVHCSDKSRMARVLAPATQVAAGFEAHLIGLSVTPPVVIIPTGMPGAPDTMVIDEHCKAYRKDNPEKKATFETAGRARNLVLEWREADAGSTSVAEVVLQHAHAADLVVAMQSDTKWPGSQRLDVTDRLVLGSGRPVLIIPNEGPQRDVGDRVLVAWNAHREVARAVFDALPLLQRAKEVRVIWVNPQSEGELVQDIPAADICTALARHGVKCEATQAVQPRTNVGQTLLAQAKDCAADLLVMGCYGHSRLREFVLGGASEHILRHMSIPVLMAH